jgi:hypothetical protein
VKEYCYWYFANVLAKTDSISKFKIVVSILYKIRHEHSFWFASSVRTTYLIQMRGCNDFCSVNHTMDSYSMIFL